jgi:hypothetical protein
LRMMLFHWFDTMVIVDPETFPGRLRKAGFSDTEIELADGAFHFRAAKL